MSSWSLRMYTHSLLVLWMIFLWVCVTPWSNLVLVRSIFQKSLRSSLWPVVWITVFSNLLLFGVMIALPLLLCVCGIQSASSDLRMLPGHNLATYIVAAIVAIGGKVAVLKLDFDTPIERTFSKVAVSDGLTFAICYFLAFIATPAILRLGVIAYGK